jgi:hypothetical protein
LAAELTEGFGRGIHLGDFAAGAGGGGGGTVGRVSQDRPGSGSDVERVVDAHRYAKRGRLRGVPGLFGAPSGSKTEGSPLARVASRVPEPAALTTTSA